MADAADPKDAARIEQALSRQEAIWGGLYGPPRAADLVAEARERHAARPDADIAEILRSLDPDDDIDPDEAGTYRPAVG